LVALAVCCANRATGQTLEALPVSAGRELLEGCVAQRVSCLMVQPAPVQGLREQVWPTVPAAGGRQRPRRGTKPMEERPCEPLATAAHGTDSSVEQSLEEGAAAPFLVSGGSGNGTVVSWSQRGTALQYWTPRCLMMQACLDHVGVRLRSHAPTRGRLEGVPSGLVQ